jgi:glucan 1,3-beta-glucosidase
MNRKTSTSCPPSVRIVLPTLTLELTLQTNRSTDNRTLTTLRALSNEAATFPFYIHDAFNLAQYGNFVAQRSDFLVEDHHSYFVFTPSDQAESAQGHTHDVNTTIFSNLEDTANLERGNLVIDEWSCALTDQSLSQESDPQDAQRDFCTEQMDVYASSSAGWAFWSYYMEDCADNGGWCFKEAVGKSLPASFFSYPAIAAAPRNPLDSMGNNIAQVLANLTANATITQIVELALASEGDIEAGNFTDIPSKNSTQKRSENGPIGLGMGHRRHQAAINERRLAHRHKPRSFSSTSSSTSPGAPSTNATGSDQTSFDRFASMNANQVAIARGYQDGFTSAKIFAQYGMSRIGFRGQYIADSLTRLVNSQMIQDGQQSTYKTWFLKGLSDGEAQITAAVTHTAPVYSHSR